MKKRIATRHREIVLFLSKEEGTLKWSIDNVHSMLYKLVMRKGYIIRKIVCKIEKSNNTYLSYQIFL